jgi:hypothetical protein
MLLYLRLNNPRAKKVVNKDLLALICVILLKLYIKI